MEEFYRDLNDLRANKVDQDEFDKNINELMQMISSLKAGKPIEIRAPSPKGPKLTEELVAKWNKASDLATKHDGEILKINTNLNELNTMKEQFKQMQQKLENCVS